MKNKVNNPLSPSLIPTNVVTGFLGAGKTTAILHLLKHKPDTERWAVLVNEFGEVGIDGALITGSHHDVTIKEVPGGCMCCTSGVPMQVALNQIIQQAKPDRLLIEPTGLGHPKEVLSVLRGESYQTVLNVGATLCLLDARKLADARYTEHETFNQQLLVSDYIIANKSEQYTSDDQSRLTNYIDAKGWSHSKQVKQVEYGKIDPKWLDDENGCQWLKSQWVFLPISPNKKTESNRQHHTNEELTNDILNNPIHIQTFQNYSQGFYAYSWVFPENIEFNLDKLKSVLSTFNAERIKAVIKTHKGWIGINWLGQIDDQTSVTEIQNKEDEHSNKIEVITMKELVQSIITKQILGSTTQPK